MEKKKRFKVWERVCVCVCVCVSVRNRESMCVCVKEKTHSWVCVCVTEREWVCLCVDGSSWLRGRGLGGGGEGDGAGEVRGWGCWDGVSVSLLTVWHTFILDLQVLVGSWTGVRKNIRTSHHHTLSPIITPEKTRERERERVREREREREVFIKIQRSFHQSTEWSSFYIFSSEWAVMYGRPFLPLNKIYKGNCNFFFCNSDFFLRIAWYKFSYKVSYKVRNARNKLAILRNKVTILRNCEKKVRTASLYLPILTLFLAIVSLYPIILTL